MTPSKQPQRPDVIKALAEALGQIDAGDLDATTAQRAYIAGARDALAGLPVAPADEPPAH